MKLLVTGASGFIGSAVVPTLRSAGHEVTGLARSDTAAETIAALGATVERGSLADLDRLTQLAAASDGVVHLAFDHDLAFGGDYDGAADVDLAAIGAISEGLSDGGALVIASGLLGVANGRIATEADPSDPDEARSSRQRNADATKALAHRGVRSSVLRLPPTVHGPGDGGFIATIIGAARRSGAAAYVGDGANRWPAVHVRDAARLFLGAVESAPAGCVLHAVGDIGVRFREIAEAIGQGLSLPTRSVTPDEAPTYLGHAAFAAMLDAPASAQRTRELLGWTPREVGLLDDLVVAGYFE